MRTGTVQGPKQLGQAPLPQLDRDLVERTNLDWALHRPAPLGQTLLSHPPALSLTTIKGTHSVGLLGPTCLNSMLASPHWG